MNKQGEQADERQKREGRAQARDPGLGVLVDDRVRRLRRDVRVVERLLQVLVGHERHAGRELCLRVDGEVVGDAGLFWMPVKNAAVSAETRIAPASAVPIDAPS